jgi:SPP1 family predicted phage head-tail adaptor
MWNAGKLRHRITIQSPPDDVAFGDKGNWTDFCTVWADIRPISGKELFEAQTIGSELSHKINIRYRAGIDSTMRIKFGDRYFYIISVINFGELNRDIQLVCKEVIVGG